MRVQEKPSSISGGLTTVLVSLAVLAYTAYIVATWMMRPWLVSTQSLWGVNNGPWDMSVRCRALSGCWISNSVNTR